MRVEWLFVEELRPPTNPCIPKIFMPKTNAPSSNQTDQWKKNKPLRVVVLGGGFGGLNLCLNFQHEDCEVVLVDRQNHHLFQPLLYQVATAGLSAPDIAQPLRSILSKRKDVRVIMGEVDKIDLEGKSVQVDGRRLDYDFLVMALGARTSFFGKEEWRKHCLGLKSLADSRRIRSVVITALEHAENEIDDKERKRLMTMLVVGGGPTGVEMAGALAELTRRVMKSDFRNLDPTECQILLVEASPHLLRMYSDDQSEYAAEKLRSMGVTVRTNCPVSDVGEGWMDVGGDKIHAATMIWAAGVESVPVIRSLAVPMDRAGRIEVEPDLSVPGHPEVFAIGDIANIINDDGTPVPGIAPAAMQMGKHVARVIDSDCDAGGVRSAGDRAKFSYFDKGQMATIGRSAAVAESMGFRFNGLLAWMGWLVIHLAFLVGMRNRLSVFISWLWAYISFKNGARVIATDERGESINEG